MSINIFCLFLQTFCYQTVYQTFDLNPKLFFCMCGRKKGWKKSCWIRSIFFFLFFFFPNLVLYWLKKKSENYWTKWKHSFTLEFSVAEFKAVHRRGSWELKSSSLKLMIWTSVHTNRRAACQEAAKLQSLLSPHNLSISIWECDGGINTQLSLPHIHVSVRADIC